MLDIFIDRVGNVNVFNILNTTSSVSTSHIQSIIDSDLINEFIKEIENIARISRTLDNKNSKSPDLLGELKSLGETFFDQFFPEEISRELKFTNEKYLHLNLDLGLKDIPWEMLYDGNQFLGDKFCIGKTVKGSTGNLKIEESKKIKMLIIADPTEDLEWAQREGEELFKILSEKVSQNILELQFLSGSQITKLKLLSHIKGKNIIHYAGHLFFSDEPMENGWLLSGNKVLKAREIVNSGFAANLVFSNSCQSSKSIDSNVNSSIMNYFAGSFLSSGINSFIGTNWEVSDNEKTLDFTKRFYLNIFKGKSLGESLFQSREFARRNYESWDITWANYTLHGSPINILLTTKKESSAKVININLIKKYFPINISRTYINFSMKDQMKENPKELYKMILQSFEEFSKIIGIIIFSDHTHKSLGKVNFEPNVSLQKWWENIFLCMSNFKKLEISMILDTIMEILSTHRDMIFKMVNWMELFSKQDLQEEIVQGYLVTFQYYYENILMELNEFQNIHLYYFPINSKYFYLMDGIDPIELQLDSMEEVLVKIKNDFNGKVVLFHKLKKNFLPLNGLVPDNSENMTHSNYLNLSIFPTYITT
jgi:CHAT domain-containing protein